MKIVKLMLGMGVIINFLAGCSMNAESKPEHTQFAQSFPFTINQLDTSGMGVETGNMRDKGVLMKSRVYAYKEGENKVSITKTHTRNNPTVTVAYSVYLYEEKNNQLELIKHTAEQKGLTGGWSIPILVPSDVKLLATNRNDENWKSISRGSVKFVGRMTDSKTGDFGLFAIRKALKTSILNTKNDPGLETLIFGKDIDLEPARLSIVFKDDCRNSQYNLRATETSLLMDNLPIPVQATCGPGELGSQLTYRLHPLALKMLREKEEKTDEVIFSIDSQKFRLPLAGFTFAETQTRRMPM
ncbi:hypothetical protein [Psychromonas antarctica]|uniref:hypothetical protein n=1 Tax=Psychromonas antarctica TaxID=67573 RepID=UPI001EE995C8|nr:hypothetical protein [Psychromonas antarctica]MCG6202035.1 hypothetical protein [Psychromonas antarctica]